MSGSASSPQSYIETNRERFLNELKELLSIPSISTLIENKPDIERAAEFVAQHCRQAGLEHVQVIATAGHPLVYADWLSAPGQPTVLVYGHYDVQPVDPIDLWNTHPFTPTIKGDNLYCRGACDDKGQFYIHIKAIETLLQSMGKLPVNVKVLIEGEEECGGVAVEKYVREHPEVLKADLVLVSDTEMLSKEIPAICYGLRGITYLELQVQGADHDLHSGMYGGVAPNPLQALAQMLASLKDSTGRIHIEGFYDRVRTLTSAEKEAFAQVPFDEEEYRQKEVGVTTLVGEPGYTPLERLWARPTFEVHGIRGGFVGEGAKTVIPAVCTAKISMRLVPDQDPEEINRLFRAQVQHICPPGVSATVNPIHTGNSVLVPLDNAGMRAARGALEDVFGQPPVFIRSGGSIPIVALFTSVLHIPTVLMGFGLPDDNLHAPNEKFYLPNFFKGIQAVIRFYERLGGSGN